MTVSLTSVLTWERSASVHPAVSQYIVAVEPVTASLLRQNIQLNDVPVRVIEGALGDGNPKKIRWDDCEVISPTYPLHKIIRNGRRM